MTELEVELLEEPLVLTGLVLLFQSLSHNLLGLFSLRWLVQCIRGNSVLERLNVQRVSSWHQVVVVDDLHERLDSGSLGNLLGVVSLGDSLWASLDTDNEGVWERVGLGAVIVGSDDNNLLTSETATGDNSCLLVLSCECLHLLIGWNFSVWYGSTCFVVFRGLEQKFKGGRILLMDGHTGTIGFSTSVEVMEIDGRLWNIKFS